MATSHDTTPHPGSTQRGQGFPSMRPIPTSGPTEEPAPAHYDPAAEANMIGRRGSDGDTPRAAGDADPTAEVAALIPNHRSPAPAATVGGAPLSTSADDAYRWRTDVERLSKRPPWHSVLTPDAVAGAWRALVDALAAANTAQHLVAGVNVEQRQHETAETEAIRAAAREGEPAPKAKPAPDWDRQRAQRSAAAAGLLDRARSARGAYDQAVTVALPAWRGALASQVQPAHVKAANALGAALQAYGQLVGLIEAAQAQGNSQHEEWRPLPQFGPGRQGISAALDALAKLDSSKPLTAPRLTPSRAERQAIAQMGDLHAMHSLRCVEVREDYKHTQLTRGLLLEAPPGMDL